MSDEDRALRELLERAAEVVASAKIPEELRPVAFREALLFLRDQPSSGATENTKGQKTPRRRSRGNKVEPVPATDFPSEETFFSRLADESGVAEEQLRDVLHVAADGKVQVTPPTRTLGGTVVEQARNVIALVSAGRSVGLGENPVSADAVREELNRKRCYQSNNFASKHLGPMKGFNAGANKNEIRVASKWVEEFKSAIQKVQEPAEHLQQK
jgi:hypothetical protein